MEQLEEKTFTTSRGFQYSYYHKAKGSTVDRPTLLLQHGYPDDHNLWEKVISYFLDLPYPILAPDLLGYGGTSKPMDAKMYNTKAMAKDLSELLDHEGIGKIVSIGHDFGSIMAQRMWLWYPERVLGVVLLNAVYSPPRPFDLKQVNTATEAATGRPFFAYWEFLVAPDSPRLMLTNIESTYASMHAEPKDWAEKTLCAYGALRKFIESDGRAPLRPYAVEPRVKDRWIARFRRDGFGAPLQWYHAYVNGYMWEVEKELPKERHKVTVPLLYIGASQDSASPTVGIYAPQKAGLLPHLTVKEVDSGHWQTMEVPDKTGPLIATWLQEQDFKLSKLKL